MTHTKREIAHDTFISGWCKLNPASDSAHGGCVPRAALAPNTLVQDSGGDPDFIGRVLRCTKDADEYGDDEYLIQWPDGHEDLRSSNSLIVWHLPSVFDVRAIASEVGLSVPLGKTDEALIRWFLECLRRRYDEADEIDRLLPYAIQPTICRVRSLLASVDAAREEVRVARARAEETRRELERELAIANSRVAWFEALTSCGVTDPMPLGEK